MAPKKKMTDDERKQMVERMDKDLEQFILDKIEENKDVPRKPFDFAEMEKVFWDWTRRLCWLQNWVSHSFELHVMAFLNRNVCSAPIIQSSIGL